MDLFAYAQIEDLGKIAADNGIEVPRLRGYRLMRDEQPYTKEAIEADVFSSKMDVCKWFVQACPRFTDSNMHEFSYRTDRLVKKYLIKKAETRSFCGKEYTTDVIVGFRWELLHGKARKRLKLAMKHKERAVRAQCEAFNRYAGREDVLYIHARIGGGNWGYYGGRELEKQPWFLEKVDDSFDCTYCDIYAKIGAPENET